MSHRMCTTHLPLIPTSSPEDNHDNDIRKLPQPPIGRLSNDDTVLPSPSDWDATTQFRSRSSTLKTTSTTGDSVQRLTAAEIQQLTSSPESLPIAAAPTKEQMNEGQHETASKQRTLAVSNAGINQDIVSGDGLGTQEERKARRALPSLIRTTSTPPPSRTESHASLHGDSSSHRRKSFNHAARLAKAQEPRDSFFPALASASGTAPMRAIRPGETECSQPSARTTAIPSTHLYQPLPIPPMSLPTHLQLELSAQRPSPLYMYQPSANDIPYESSAVKFERLQNFFSLPPYLERTLYFGALACLDAWLYNFTILPVKFIQAVAVLFAWWLAQAEKEGRWLLSFVWDGLGRLRERGQHGRSRMPADGRRTLGNYAATLDQDEPLPDLQTRASAHPSSRLAAKAWECPATLGKETHEECLQRSHTRANDSREGRSRHKRTQSSPSTLSAFHKADLLQGCVIVCSSVALLSLDASRMYHFIRAQSAIKLYVIYNILEVGDRLLSAIGQDIFECLFSAETLSRNASGRSKILLPLSMFLLALVYNCLHSVALYYQVITLNVAVNSYSNALLTLLMSNQFVEIKSTVFKRFEKDNLFQLTCADIVERFQLWIMLLIIGMRNIVEVGGLSVPGAGSEGSADDAPATGLHSSSILPHSFTVLPSWLKSGEVLSPFLIVVGSEMLVDAIKHAYVTKFNNIKPTFYGRILDILCKDYYTQAFVTPSLTRRLGLAVIPLSCLFIRASVQTYHMFLSTHLPAPLPQSTQTALTEESAVPSSPAMLAALNRFDSLLRGSLGRATHGYPYDSPMNNRPWYVWNSDDVIAALTMIIFFFLTFVVLLIIKLLLGMLLLKYARNRYAQMLRREQAVSVEPRKSQSHMVAGRRVGGYGTVEVGDDRQNWIHADTTEGLKETKQAVKRQQDIDKPKRQESDANGPFRFEMINKRIW